MWKADESQVFRRPATTCLISGMPKRERRSAASSRERTRPASVADALTAYLKRSGLRERVEQSEVVAQWPKLVGPRIARVTEPLHVSADGVLFVAAQTSAWVSELSLLEPELLRAVNGAGRSKPIRKIRFRLMR
jgi:predicted nucleic acid-binding Zn ribbon protein